MAVSGVFLMLFLVGHLAGNLPLFQPAGEEVRLQFNAYAHFMTTNPVVKVLSYLTYATFLVHIVYAAVLSYLNYRARPVGYAKRQGLERSWASRNMGVLGFIVFFFLVIHMRSFWYEMHWGNIGTDAQGYKDLYGVVFEAFTQWWYVLLYVVCMFFLGYHLWHGYESACQTLGFHHTKYKRWIAFKGKVFAIIVPALFALIPIVMFFRTLS